MESDTTDAVLAGRVVAGASEVFAEQPKSEAEKGKSGKEDTNSLTINSLNFFLHISKQF
jgi:hypothetical protein